MVFKNSVPQFLEADLLDHRQFHWYTDEHDICMMHLKQ